MGKAKGIWDGVTGLFGKKNGSFVKAGGKSSEISTLKNNIKNEELGDWNVKSTAEIANDINKELDNFNKTGVMSRDLQAYHGGGLFKNTSLNDVFVNAEKEGLRRSPSPSAPPSVSKRTPQDAADSLRKTLEERRQGTPSSSEPKSSPTDYEKAMEEANAPTVHQEAIDNLKETKIEGSTVGEGKNLENGKFGDSSKDHVDSGLKPSENPNVQKKEVDALQGELTAANEKVSALEKDPLLDRKKLSGNLSESEQQDIIKKKEELRQARIAADKAQQKLEEHPHYQKMQQEAVERRELSELSNEFPEASEEDLKWLRDKRKKNGGPGTNNSTSTNNGGQAPNTDYWEGYGKQSAAHEAKATREKNWEKGFNALMQEGKLDKINGYLNGNYKTIEEARAGGQKMMEARRAAGPAFQDYMTGYKVPQRAAGLAVAGSVAAGIAGGDNGQRTNAQLYSSPF